MQAGPLHEGLGVPRDSGSGSGSTPGLPVRRARWANEQAPPLINHAAVQACGQNASGTYFRTTRGLYTICVVGRARRRAGAQVVHGGGLARHVRVPRALARRAGGRAVPAGGRCMRADSA